jgi:hypothetical protein
MQNRQEDGPLHIETKLSLWLKAVNDLADLQLLPEPLADQGRSDLPRIRPDIALCGEDQQHFFRKSREGTYQVLDLSLLLNLIHPPDRGDNPLDGLGPFSAVLDDLEVLIQSGSFHSRKHRDTSRI